MEEREGLDCQIPERRREIGVGALDTKPSFRFHIRNNSLAL